jgi:hypothetical protein
MSALHRTTAFFKRHPVVLLAFLTPGIPEYLSSSSALNAIILNPVFFPIQLVLNLGLYTPGALLIREAMIRWNKGLGTVLIMGVAYGILEEGVALSTLFDPNASAVGVLGSYGHYAGVNWVWVAGILPFHAIFSIAMPIVLLGLALPHTNGERFLQGKKLHTTVAILILDVIALMLFVYGLAKFWMGDTVFVGSLVAIAILVYMAWRAPRDFGLAKVGGRLGGPRTTFVVGVALWPVAVLSQSIPESAGVPAALDFILVIVVQTLFMVYILRAFSSDNDRREIIMAVGLILPIAIFGVIAELALPVILLADAAFVLFFRKLLRKYPSR